MGKSEDMIEFVEDRPGHDFRYSMSSDKISKKLGWRIENNFEKGIENTVNWYNNNKENWKDISMETLKSTPWKN